MAKSSNGDSWQKWASKRFKDHPEDEATWYANEVNLKKCLGPMLRRLPVEKTLKDLYECAHDNTITMHCMQSYSEDANRLGDLLDEFCELLGESHLDVLRRAIVPTYSDDHHNPDGYVAPPATPEEAKLERLIEVAIGIGALAERLGFWLKEESAKKFDANQTARTKGVEQKHRTAERRKQVAEQWRQLVGEKKRPKVDQIVKQIAKTLDVSTRTIWRDLDHLEKKGEFKATDGSKKNLLTRLGCQ